MLARETTILEEAIGDLLVSKVPTQQQSTVKMPLTRCTVGLHALVWLTVEDTFQDLHVRMFVESSP